MTKFYKFPDDVTYQSLEQNEIPYVVLGRVPNGGEEIVEINGEMQTVPTYHEGYHVNAMREVPSWSQYIIDDPSTPWMIFA